MINDIPHSSLFATPKDVTDLNHMIKQLPAVDQALVYKYTMLAFNLAYKLAAEQTEDIAE